jgi:hypothetical protein
MSAHERIRQLHAVWWAARERTEAYEALGDLPHALPEIADALEAAEALAYSPRLERALTAAPTRAALARLEAKLERDDA